MLVPGVEAVLLGLIASVALDRLRVPVGSLIGAILGVVVARILGFAVPDVPDWAAAGAAILVGVSVAVRFSRGLAVNMRQLVWPTMIVAGSMVAIGSLTGIVLSTFTEWTLATTMFGALPAGLEQMILVADVLGGDASVVATLQMVRWFGIVLGYPLILRWLYSGRKRRTPVETHAGRWVISDYISIVIGVAGGVGGYLLGIPAGALLGSFIGVAAVRATLCDHGIRPSPLVSRLIILVIGVITGGSIHVELLTKVGLALLCALGLTMELIVIGALLALTLHRWKGWDMVTCVLATAPAGMLEMTLLSQELGLDPVPVLTMHFARTASVIVTGPLLYRLSLEMMPLWVG